jgi:hypothetical protein
MRRVRHDGVVAATLHRQVVDTMQKLIVHAVVAAALHCGVCIEQQADAAGHVRDLASLGERIVLDQVVASWKLVAGHLLCIRNVV